VGRSNERDSVAQAEFEADALWKKKKRVKYFESVEAAQTTLNLKPMLAQDYKKRLAKDQIVFPVTVQPKLDGNRAFVYRQDGRAVMMSRGGKPIDMRHIIGEADSRLPAGDRNLILDGELYCRGMTFQQLTSLIKKFRDPESLQVQMHCYDYTTTEGGIPWSTRQHLLEETFYTAFRDTTYEGAIVRLVGHEYRFGYRSPGLLKLKDFDEKEFPIIGWTTGKDDVPKWVVRLENGEELAVRPQGTAEQRAEALRNADQQIGKWLTVRFKDRTEAGKPKIAVGKGIRDASDM
jgi:ATP-dependent DNA ligase